MIFSPKELRVQVHPVHPPFLRACTNFLRWPEFKCIKESLSILKLHTLDYRHTGIETFASNEKCRKLTAKIGKKQQTYEVKI